MKSNISRPAINKTVAASLIFWLSGLMFLFCCEMPKAQAAETDACPLAKISHCNKKTVGANISQFASVQSEIPSLDCCQLLPSIFSKVRKIEQNPQTVQAATTIRISLPQFSFVETELNTPKIYRPPVLNRGGTYLKNLVFRI